MVALERGVMGPYLGSPCSALLPYQLYILLNFLFCSALRVLYVPLQCIQKRGQLCKQYCRILRFQEYIGQEGLSLVVPRPHTKTFRTKRQPANSLSIRFNNTTPVCRNCCFSAMVTRQSHPVPARPIPFSHSSRDSHQKRKLSLIPCCIAPSNMGGETPRK